MNEHQLNCIWFAGLFNRAERERVAKTAHELGFRIAQLSSTKIEQYEIIGLRRNKNDIEAFFELAGVEV